MATFYLPTRVVHGIGSLEQLTSILKGLDVHKPLIVTDEGIVMAGLLKRVTDILENGRFTYSLYSKVGHQATVNQVREAVAIGKAENCDSIIGFGGGSCLVAGRASGVAMTNQGNLLDFEGIDQLTKEPIPIISIPTTAGSGSEVSQFIPLIEDSKQRKFVIGGRMCFSKVAILDAMLLETVPPEQAAMSGIDALTHAMEAFLTSKATPITDALALSAIKIIKENLCKVILTDSLEARDRCLVASTMANMACCNALLGLVHSLARPINSLFQHITYGLTIGVLLIPVMEFNLIASEERFCQMAAAFGGVPKESQRSTAEEVINQLKILLSDINFPRKFEQTEHFNAGVIPKLVGMVFEGMYGRQKETKISPKAIAPGVHLRKATYSDVVKLYEAAFRGWEL